MLRDKHDNILGHLGFIVSPVRCGTNPFVVNICKFDVTKLFFRQN